MNYQEHIQRSIDYMEENLIFDIDLSSCAKASGYSEYHFLRIFKEAVGLTPGEYIRKRRLTECAKKILTENGYMSDIGYRYGFNSKENFIRAFKAEHGVAPGEYKAAKNSLKLYERFDFHLADFFLKPEIKELSETTLIVYEGGNTSPPKFWNQYNCRKLSKKLSGGKVCRDYGVSIMKERLYYYIGIEKCLAQGELPETVELVLKGGLYAIFTTPETSQNNFVNTIHTTWKFINQKWLPFDKYERLDCPEYETYMEESRSFSEKIYIPIKERK